MPANTHRKGNKAKANNTTWRKGISSPNPTGRPKDGQSWREVIAEVSNMTVDDILSIIGETNDLGKAMKQMPKSVQMKYLVTARVMVALMFEPTAGLWNGLMDRMEGKVPDHFHEYNQLEVEGLTEILDKVYGKQKDIIG